MLSNALFTAYHFCALDVLQLCSPDNDEVNLCTITSRRKSNEPAFILVKKSVGNCKLVGYTEIENAQPILVSHTIPTTSMNTLEPCRVFANMSMEITTKYSHLFFWYRCNYAKYSYIECILLSRQTRLGSIAAYNI